MQVETSAGKEFPNTAQQLRIAIDSAICVKEFNS